LRNWEKQFQPFLNLILHDAPLPEGAQMNFPFFQDFIILAYACLAFALGIEGSYATMSRLDLGQPTFTPTGWAEFCIRYKGDCEKSRARMQEVVSSDANMALIDRVNKQVNHSIKPLTDIEHWHEIDRWHYADGSG
jgi:predicted transglutaminase-like cysteine proteinase